MVEVVRPCAVDVAFWGWALAAVLREVAMLRSYRRVQVRERTSQGGKGEGEILKGLESDLEAAHIWACPAGAVAPAANGTNRAVSGEADTVEERGGHG